MWAQSRFLNNTKLKKVGFYENRCCSAISKVFARFPLFYFRFSGFTTASVENFLSKLTKFKYIKYFTNFSFLSFVIRLQFKRNSLPSDRVHLTSIKWD